MDSCLASQKSCCLSHYARPWTVAVVHSVVFAAGASDAGAVAVEVADAVAVEQCQEMATSAATGAVEAKMESTVGLAQIVLSVENSAVAESSTALSDHRQC